MKQAMYGIIMLDLVIKYWKLKNHICYRNFTKGLLSKIITIKINLLDYSMLQFDIQENYDQGQVVIIRKALKAYLIL